MFIIVIHFSDILMIHFAFKNSQYEFPEASINEILENFVSFLFFVIILKVPHIVGERKMVF